MTIWGDLKEFSINFVKYFYVIIHNYTFLYTIYTKFIHLVIYLYIFIHNYTLFYLFLHYFYIIYTIFIHYLDTIYFHKYVTCTGDLPLFLTNVDIFVQSASDLITNFLAS